MSKVLYAPFGSGVKDPHPEAHSVLVWKSHKRIKILTQNIARDPEGKKRLDGRYETTAEFLNNSQCLSDVKEMLRSIVYTWRMGEDIRREMNSSRKPFFSSFRGHGGSGVDGYG